jgi:SAM-dependent methyltransferase
MRSPEPLPYPSFDAQSAGYDRRAGLPAGVPAAVAAVVAGIAELGRGNLLVEIGAGTGQIGGRLSTAAAAAGARFAALDLSFGMLAGFRGRLAGGGTPLLLQADGSASWPFGDGSTRALFSSRAIHHLDPGHAAAEAARLAQPSGAVVLLGRVGRDPESPSSALRREMRRRLAAAGCPPRDAGGRRERFLVACCGRGAELIETRIVSRWPVATSARRSLDAWAGKPGLAGTDPPAAVKRRVLGELAEWAAAAFDGLDREDESEEAYLLEGARFPAGNRA